jgi:hypothetical protein
VPYITENDRARLRRDPVARCAGEINFLVTRALLNAIHIGGLSYATINTIVSAICSAQDSLRTGKVPSMSLARDFYSIAAAAKEHVDADESFGALECCKMEFYSRVVVDYERRKCRENGDVYPA